MDRGIYTSTKKNKKKLIKIYHAWIKGYDKVQAWNINEHRGLTMLKLCDKMDDIISTAKFKGGTQMVARNSKKEHRYIKVTGSLYFCTDCGNIKSMPVSGIKGFLTRLLRRATWKSWIKGRGK